MKTAFAAVACAALLTAGASFAATPSTPAANKELATRFYNALIQGDIATVRALGRPDYRQHNPFFEDTIEGLAKGIAARPPRPAGSPPPPPLEFVRSAAEGDLVWFLRRQKTPDGKDLAGVDIFRIQDGKVAEHWDYYEAFPRGAMTPKNSNGPF